VIAGGGPAGIKKSSLVSSQVQQADTVSSSVYSLDNYTKQFLPAQEQLRLSMK
jgi:hypothetical protein